MSSSPSGDDEVPEIPDVAGAFQQPAEPQGVHPESKYRTIQQSRNWLKPRYVRQPDVADPQRSTAANSNHDYEGIPALRVLRDIAAKSGGRAASTKGTRPGWMEGQIQQIEREAGEYKPRRVVGVVFDSVSPFLPTAMQQFDMIRLYCEANPRLVWDGWEDTCVQFLDPHLDHQNFELLNVADHIFWHLHDHNHVVLPTLAFLADRKYYLKATACAICRGKTMAILDHGIDTFRFPRQLAVTAADMAGTVTSPYLSIVGGKLNKKYKAIGHVSAGGRVIPNRKLREQIEKIARVIDSGICMNSDPKGFNQALCSIWMDMYSLPQRSRTKTASIYYLAHKLEYPAILTSEIARAIVTYGKMDVAAYGPQVFDKERATTIMNELATQSGKAWKVLVAINADRDARRLFKRASQAYRAPVSDRWVTEAMAASPPRVINDPREPVDSLARRIVRELRNEMADLSESDESLLKGYVGYIAQRLYIIENKIKSPNRRKKISELPIGRGPRLTMDEKGVVRLRKGSDIIRNLRAKMKKSRENNLAHGIVIDETGEHLEYTFPTEEKVTATIDSKLRELDGTTLLPAWSGDDDPAGL